MLNIVKISFIGPDIGKEHKIEVLNPQFEKCNFNYHPDKDKGGKHIVLRPRENKKTTKQFSPATQIMETKFSL